MDIQLGYALLRDRRVPIRPKLIALAIGAAVVGFTELLQIPLESLFAVILPIVGIAGDVVLDGVEAVFGPVLIATLLLPYLAPDPVVQQIRAERARPVWRFKREIFFLLSRFVFDFFRFSGFLYRRPCRWNIERHADRILQKLARIAHRDGAREAVRVLNPIQVCGGGRGQSEARQLKTDWDPWSWNRHAVSESLLAADDGSIWRVVQSSRRDSEQSPGGPRYAVYFLFLCWFFRCSGPRT
jgi:hypothetical protein